MASGFPGPHSGAEGTMDPARLGATRVPPSVPKGAQYPVVQPRDRVLLVGIGVSLHDTQMNLFDGICSRHTWGCVLEVDQRAHRCGVCAKIGFKGNTNLLENALSQQSLDAQSNDCRAHENRSGSPRFACRSR